MSDTLTVPLCADHHQLLHTATPDFWRMMEAPLYDGPPERRFWRFFPLLVAEAVKHDHTGTVGDFWENIMPGIFASQYKWLDEDFAWGDDDS